MYGTHKSNNTNAHHPSMLAMDAVDDDDEDMDDNNHHDGAYGNRDFHMINPGQAQMRGQHDSSNQRNRINSGERNEGRPQFGQMNNRYGQQGFYWKAQSDQWIQTMTWVIL